MLDLTELPIDIREEILSFTATRVVTGNRIDVAILFGPLDRLIYRYKDDLLCSNGLNYRVAPNAKLISNHNEYKRMVKNQEYRLAVKLVSLSHVLYAVRRRQFVRIKEFTRMHVSVARLMRAVGALFDYVYNNQSDNVDIALKLYSAGQLHWIEKLPQCHVREFTHFTALDVAGIKDNVTAEKFRVKNFNWNDDVTADSFAQIESIQTLWLCGNWSALADYLAPLASRINICQFARGFSNILSNNLHIYSYDENVNTLLASQQVVETVYISSYLKQSVILPLESSIKTVYSHSRCTYDAARYTETVGDLRAKYPYTYTRRESRV